MSMFMRLLQDERGATAIEYAFIAASIFVVIVAAVASIGTSLTAIFTSVNAGFGAN
ncbi:pilus assembly protein Flp/PilA [Rhizobiales bacterium GAS191]|nr:pilus assembly protein Flp/PilA [Rhizobiales bacterium GAS188]SEE30976.1 pilus assembly protein Flp/PilA [Rhizobiales bacterium GAS191]